MKRVAALLAALLLSAPVLAVAAPVIANFPPKTGGGGGTITTSAPLSGDGSVGTPATIAVGALNLNILASIADQRILCNVSGVSASPIACTAAQIATMLGLPNFGTDTTLTLADSLAAPVTSFEAINTLSPNTAAAYTGRWVLKLPSVGTLTTALTLDPALLTLPGALTTGSTVTSGSVFIVGTNGSTSSPGFQVATGSERTGFDRPFPSVVGITASGSRAGFIAGQGFLTNGSIGTGFWFDTAGTSYGLVLSGASPFNITTKQAGATGDFQVNASGALATSATVGFIDIGNMAGKPSALATGLQTGHTAVTSDSTNHKLWFEELATARWYSTPREGKGTDVASGSTVTIAAGDRTAFDYFKFTGTTDSNYLTYTASDVYGAILDGQCVTFRASGNVTFKNNTGSVPANTKPFLNSTSADAVLLAGAIIRYCRDDDAGGFVEQFRRAP